MEQGQEGRAIDQQVAKLATEQAKASTWIAKSALSCVCGVGAPLNAFTSNCPEENVISRGGWLHEETMPRAREDRERKGEK